MCHSQICEVHNICPECWKKLSFISQPYCQSCGAPLPYESEQVTLCTHCTYKEEKLIKVRASLCYDEHSKKLILPFKHGDQTHYAATLARIMGNHLRGIFQLADLVCPVPLHWLRLWRRKYNQSALLIQHLPRQAEAHWVPILDLLIRRKRTKSQQGLTNSERQANLEDSIIVNPNYTSLLKNKICVIVDDVQASGATLDFCAKVVLVSGAKSVYGAVIAKTVKASGRSVSKEE